jgi:hypothetical protein
MKNAINEMKLQLNYVCYDKEMISKLSKVWDAFFKLEEAFNSPHNNARDETVRCCINCATKCDITVNLEMCYNAGGILFTPRTASTVA